MHARYLPRSSCSGTGSLTQRQEVILRSTRAPRLDAQLEASSDVSLGLLAGPIRERCVRDPCCDCRPPNEGLDPTLVLHPISGGLILIALGWSLVSSPLTTRRDRRLAI
jgi:hypothetical protein